jgi:hypothetical protein
MPVIIFCDERLDFAVSASFFSGADAHPAENKKRIDRDNAQSDRPTFFSDIMCLQSYMFNSPGYC